MTPRIVFLGDATFGGHYVATIKVATSLVSQNLRGHVTLNTSLSGESTSSPGPLTDLHLGFPIPDSGSQAQPVLSIPDPGIAGGLIPGFRDWQFFLLISTFHLQNDIFGI